MTSLEKAGCSFSALQIISLQKNKKIICKALIPFIGIKIQGVRKKLPQAQRRKGPGGASNGYAGDNFFLTTQKLSRCKKHINHYIAA
ncbi:MAG: hypothetical protein K0A99_06115 [Desulfoarculaceae bacterium]|nr:hypothetical protein [Desulfoarculaceae bacterium]